MESSALQRYRFWCANPYFDVETREELSALADQPAEIEERFYTLLDFGTAGLRGLLGAGTNRMNRYVVRQTAHALAACIAGAAARQRGVVIAYDSRHGSPAFAREAALTLAAAGVRAYLWESLRPTPLLSYAVRWLSAAAGIMITASHNPAAYNGLKVYDDEGGQVSPERAAAIAAQMQAIADLTAVVPMPEAAARERGLLLPVPPAVDHDYQAELLTLCRAPQSAPPRCRVLYTPLHGSGNLPVRTALAAAGYAIAVVAAQENPDPDFSTVQAPNPEEEDVYALALQQAERERPDLILATDPDADRLGVMAPDEAGRYRLLTGNQIGLLLTAYLLAHRRERGVLPADGVVIKSIASTNMVAPLCREYGVGLLQTHIGFKYIADHLRAFAKAGRPTFLFGFEESYGYLAAPFVRDKDAVMAALLVAEAATYYRQHGQSLYAALQALWQRYGYYMEATRSIRLSGREGQAEMQALMTDLRAEPPRSFAGLPVAYIDDYAARCSLATATGATQPLPLDRADVLHYRFADGGFVMVRPSGTEPKLKLYVSVCGADQGQAELLLARVMQAALGRLRLC